MSVPQLHISEMMQINRPSLCVALCATRVPRPVADETTGPAEAGPVPVPTRLVPVVPGGRGQAGSTATMCMVFGSTMTIWSPTMKYS